MRKQLSLAAIAALGALTCSCIHEREFVQYTPEPNAISFVIGSTLTRAEKEAKPQVNRYSLGSDDHGHLFTLEETVTWMDGIGNSPATRGTPAYSENLLEVHGGAFDGRAYNASTGAQVIEDGSFFLMEDGVRWRRAFGFDPWPTNGDDLTFFINMPTEAPGLTITNFNGANGTISFSYQTPETAAEQQDILFAKTTLDKETYMTAYQNNGGAPILLRHALTGIKFAIASDVNDTDEESGSYPENKVETFITKVEFTGLVSKGSAVYNQDDSNESGTNGDVAGTHSSKTSFTWTPDETSRDAVFYQEFTEDNIITYLNPYAQPEPGEGGEGGEGEEGGGEGSIDDNVHAAESFYLAGNERNLNDERASLTFWFIPQVMTADVKVRVTFYVWDGVNAGVNAGEEVTRELNLGQEILNQQSVSNLNLDWKAGQIRTFKLSPTSIDVDLAVEPDPEVANTIGTPDIRNIGNKDAYLRVAILGNWVDSDGNIIMGTVTTTTNDETGVTTTTHTPITPWTEGNTTFGTFTNLGPSGWVKKTDGYWYYTQPVPAGKRPGETASGGTYVPLFEAYTKGTAPDEDLTLKLDVAVQAIDAKAGATYEAAWANPNVGAL